MKRIYQLIFIAVLSFTYTFINIVPPSHSQSIAACASNPVCAAELGLLATTAVAVTAIAVTSDQLSNNPLAKLFGYSQGDVSSLQDTALSQQDGLFVRTVKTQGMADYLGSAYYFIGTQLTNDAYPKKFDCEAAVIQSFGTLNDMYCTLLNPKTWAQLTEAERASLMGTDAAKAAIQSLVAAKSNQALNDYNQIAQSASAAAIAAWLARDVTVADLQTKRANDAAAAAAAAASIAGSSGNTSAPDISAAVASAAASANKAKSDYLTANSTANPTSTPTTAPTTANPTSTPTTAPTAPPLEYPTVPPSVLPSKSFSGSTNFLVYAVTAFSSKFPFDIVFGATTVSLPPCPEFSLFYYKWQLCFLMPLFLTIRWITFISITTKVILEL